MITLPKAGFVTADHDLFVLGFSWFFSVSVLIRDGILK